MWVYKSIPAKGGEFFFGWEEGISGKFCIFVVCVMILRMRWLCGLLMVVLLVGCSTDERTLQLIGEAEGVMIEHPDSALTIMRSVDVETIRGKEDMAHYRLAMAEAYYHNDSCSLALTQPLFDYYLSSDDHAKRARALYLHALVLWYGGDNTNAMYSLLEAEKSLINSTNSRLIGNVHLTKGELYSNECLFENSLESFYKALHYFELAKLDYHVAYVQYRIGESLSIKKMYDESELYLRSALDLSLARSYRGISSLAIDELIFLLINEERYSEISSLKDLFEKHNLTVFYPVSHYYSLAIFESYYGNRDKALQYVELAGTYENIEHCEIEYYNYLVFNNLGDHKDALDWLKKNRIQQQQLMLESLEFPIINMQVEALNQEIKIADAYKQNVRLSYIIICIVVVLFVLVICRYVIKKRKQYQFEVTQYIEAIRELQMVDRGVNVSMSEQIYNIYKTRFTELNKLCDIYYDHHDSDRQKGLVFRQLQDTIESLKSDSVRIEEMESVVNLYCNNIMVKLNDECPSLSERQRRIALYIFAGFSLRAIALFMNSNPVQISKDKYKIKDVIKKGDVPSRDLFMMNLDGN